MTQDDAIAKELGAGKPAGVIKWKRRLVISIGAVALAIVLMQLFMPSSGGNGTAYKFITQETKRGPLTIAVTATGTLEPVNQVSVGSELSGTVVEVMVDFNHTVKRNQPLARLDQTSLEAQAVQTEAVLNSAIAKLNEAKATLKETEANYARLKQTWEASEGAVPSLKELDAAEATLERSRAALTTAEAQIAETRARLAVSRDNLTKTTIRSPIDGIILSRAVEPGQTVAASFQAPVLFTIAETLTKMELHVFVDEADVGQIRVGHTATFTVDAHPERSYKARISEIRNMPTKTDGVVTYETILLVDNTDLTLRPGMTATAEIVTSKIEDALLVPNAALRFSPPKAPEGSSASLIDKLFMRPTRRPAQNDKQKPGERGSRVYLLEAGQPVALPVKTGATDGIHTVVLEGKLSAGQQVIVGAGSASRK